ncbi:MFS transporter [Chryseobacterium sp.]|uniref:MFS transporter n=1 Tax=Chryseobacterium sp. TaxID=1871047 RepID=UPI0025BDB27D|nr:MFS transporter [Chryseobacterium sp.]
MNKDTISLKEKIGYGFGDAASSMFWKIFGMYSLFFYTDVFGITAAAAGTMFLIARLWDSVFDVFVGIAADRTKTKWGKYRPYLLWFAIPFALMGVITFYVPDFSTSGKLIYAYITYSLVMIVYSLINVPYASLLGAISPNPEERNSLSSYRMAFAFIGSFVTFMLLQPLIDFFAERFDPQSLDTTQHIVENSVSTSAIAWAMGVGVIGLLCVILFILCFSWTKERVQQIESEENVSITTDLKNLFNNSPWWILVGTGLAALLFNAIRDSVAIYYFRDYVQVNYKMSGTGWDITTIYFLIGQAANLIGVIAAPTISAKYGKKKTYMISILLAGFFSVIFYFIPNNLTFIFILQFLISVFAGYVLPLLWSMFADIVDHQEFLTGRRATGLIFSSSSMSQKLGWALGAALSGWILAWFNYVPDAPQQTADTIFGERLMISLLPAACCILAFVGMIFYPLTDKKVKEITRQLEEKRNS